MSNHTCHAKGCSRNCKPEFLMCGPHWRHVPRGIQALVYRNYRAGQCDDGNVTAEWHAAADLAIAWVAHKEGRISTDTRDRIAAKARGVLAPSRGHS